MLGAASDVGLALQIVPRLVAVLASLAAALAVSSTAEPRTIERWSLVYALVNAAAFALSGSFGVASPQSVFLALAAHALVAALFLPIDPRWTLVMSAGAMSAFLGLGSPRADLLDPTWLDMVLLAGVLVALSVGTAARLRTGRRLAYANFLRERTLREDNERLGRDFVRLFDRNPTPLAITRPETGRVLRVNRRLRRLFRLAPDAPVEQMRVFDFYRDAEDRARVVEAFRREGAARQDARLVAADGTPIDVTLEA